MKAEELKGHLDGLILSVVSREPLHGYAVIEALKARSGGRLALPEGTVYPALHRLEADGLLQERVVDGQPAGAGASTASPGAGKKNSAPAVSAGALFASTIEAVLA